jgi:hypothetical protein
MKKTAIFTGFSTFAMGAPRTQDTIPTGLRWARKPDGEKVLQAGYLWREGDTLGIDWRDVETVDAANGNYVDDSR